MRAEGSKKPTFNGVQALRGMAACMVLVCHATNLWSHNVGLGILPPFWEKGAAGVDIFFVISGVVMAVSSLNGPKGWAAAGSFMERRLTRVLPLYWLITLLTVSKFVVSRLRPELGLNHSHTVYTVPYVVTSLLFIPYPNPMGGISPVVEPGWTLSFEMLFYMLFALALGLRKDVLRLLTPVMVVLAAIGLFYDEQSWPAITRLLNPILLEFLAGIFLGRAVLNGFRMKTMYWAPLGVLGLATIFALPIYEFPGARLLEWGIPAFFIVQAGVMLEEKYGGWVPLWALVLGDASYSLYLVHTVVNSAVGKVLTKVHLPVEGVVRWRDEFFTVLACLLVSVTIAVLLYRFVERPMTLALQRRLHLRRRRLDALGALERAG